MRLSVLNSLNSHNSLAFDTARGKEKARVRKSMGMEESVYTVHITKACAHVRPYLILFIHLLLFYLYKWGHFPSWVKWITSVKRCTSVSSQKCRAKITAHFKCVKFSFKYYRLQSHRRLTLIFFLLWIIRLMKLKCFCGKLWQ